MQQLPLFTPPSDWKPPTELPDLRNRKVIALDLETKDEGLAQSRGPGWVYDAGYIAGVAMAAEDIAVYAPIRHPDGDCLDPDRVKEWVSDHVKSGVKIVYHHAPYDCGWSQIEWGLSPPENLEDTQAMAFILDENRLEYGLDAVCKWQGVPGKDEAALNAAALAYGFKGGGVKGVKANLWRLPARYVGPYAAQDAAATLGARAAMLPKIAEQGLEKAYQLECDLIPMVLAMRTRGIRIDIDAAVQLQKHFYSKRDQYLKQISRELLIGRDVTVKDTASTKFLERVFTDLKIPYPQTEKSKQGSFSTEWMSKSEHWLPQAICNVMKYQDAAHKFIGGYILDFTHRGRIHADIHQYKDERGGTITYRLSYSEPPLQQMPAPNRDVEIGTAVRTLFLPEPGEIWSANDYSQQEYRLIVHFSKVCKVAGAQAAVRKYLDNPDTDFHNMVVEMTGLLRPAAKDANFAKAFGAGVSKFALMIAKSEEEAEAIYKQYDENMPFVARLAEFCKSRADQRGYIKMLDGARGRFDDWECSWLSKEERSKAWKEGQKLNPCPIEEARERQADPNHVWNGKRLKRAKTHKSMNKLIQGSAARQTKMAMREIWRMGQTPLIQMHDELDFSLSDHKIAVRITEIMRDIVKLEIPMKVDAEYGTSWGRASKIKGGYGATWEEAWKEAA